MYGFHRRLNGRFRSEADMWKAGPCRSSIGKGRISSTTIAPPNAFGPTSRPPTSKPPRDRIRVPSFICAHRRAIKALGITSDD